MAPKLTDIEIRNPSLVHSNLESTARHLGIEVDDALEIAHRRRRERLLPGPEADTGAAIQRVVANNSSMAKAAGAASKVPLCDSDVTGNLRCARRQRHSRRQRERSGTPNKTIVDGAIA
jgi:hypothetical protein